MELHVNIDRQLKISTNSSPLVNPGSNNSNYKNNNQFQQKIMLRLLKLRHVRTSKGNLQGHGYLRFHNIILSIIRTVFNDYKIRLKYLHLY
jgi:hypothetical protein